MKFDYAAAGAGIRTAGALLIGNSILVHQGVLGQTLKDAELTAAKVFIIGMGILILASFARGKP